MHKFKHNYLIFDEFGLKQLLCMGCSKVIKSRSEIKSNHYPNSIIRELGKHADYREVPVMLENGRLAFIMVCDDCKFAKIGEEEAKDISNQFKEALKAQLIHEGKTNDLIDEVVKHSKYNVLRKAEVSEVTAALRGV